MLGCTRSAASAPIESIAPLARGHLWARRTEIAWWETTVALAGIAAAAAAVVVTLRSDFLAYPGWLAVQKADVILGPIAVGLYWRRRRPQSRFGPMLIAVGFLHVPYIAQSSSNSGLFTLGVHWEVVIYLATLALILGFPSGRLRRIDRMILAVATICAAIPSSAIVLFSPVIYAGGTISACRAACPANALFVSSSPGAVKWLFEVDRAAIIAIAFGTAALLVWRFATGTQPRRRALAIGTPLALVFLLTQGGYQVILALGGADRRLNTDVRWVFVVARSALWYGFLLALVEAQLFAGRVLRRVAAESLRRPSLGQLAALLREPLGDTRLRLAFWQRGPDVWIDGDGNAVEQPTAGSGTALTTVERDGDPAAAILHDVQLADDPELLQAAAATVLLAFENAKLQAAWDAALRELKDSRARLASASAHERRSLEQDLHDGAQEALVALRIKLALASEDSPQPDLRHRLHELGTELDAAIAELRDLAHGIYPSLLAEFGPVAALTSVAQRASRGVTVRGDGVGRYPPEVESALYYCCREGLQNAIRHAGTEAHIAIRLRQRDDELTFEVEDDGDGFVVEDSEGCAGDGLRNIRDRVGALDGTVRIASAPGAGTLVSAALPFRTAVR